MFMGKYEGMIRTQSVELTQSDRMYLKNKSEAVFSK